MDGHVERRRKLIGVVVLLGGKFLCLVSEKIYEDTVIYFEKQTQVH